MCHIWVLNNLNVEWGCKYQTYVSAIPASEFKGNISINYNKDENYVLLKKKKYNRYININAYTFLSNV